MGMQTSAATIENSMESTQKVKIRATLWYSNSTAGYLLKDNKNTKLKRYMYPYVYCSIIYNSQDMEATYMSSDRWMDKDVSYLHNGILLRHKKNYKA